MKWKRKNKADYLHKDKDNHARVQTDKDGIVRLTLCYNKHWQPPVVCASVAEAKAAGAAKMGLGAMSRMQYTV